MNYSGIIQIVCYISILSSLSVILTLCFKGLRQKLFMQIIAVISACDFIANIPYASTKRYPDDSANCVIQGFINIYFYPVSWLWTAALMSLLYSLATTGKLPLSYPRLHMICWIVPLILAMLNFAAVNTNNAAAKGRFAFEICSLGDASFASELYHMITYYGLLVFCCITMLTMYVKILFTENQFPMLEQAKNTLILYPIALCACWIPHVVAVIIVDYDYSPGENTFYLVADCIKILHGTVTAVIFFYKSTEARSRWSRFFHSLVSAIRVAVGLPPLAVETSNAAVAADFSVEYEDFSERGSVAEAHPYYSDDKQGDISAVHLWGGFLGGGGGSHSGSRSNSTNSRTNSTNSANSRNNSTAGGPNVNRHRGNSILNSTQSRLHSKEGELRDSILEMS